MKLTVKQLKRLIKEEVNKALKENLDSNKPSNMHEAWPGTGTDRLENFADSMSDEEYVDYIKGKKDHNKWLTAKNTSTIPISKVVPPSASKGTSGFKEEVGNVIDEGSKEAGKAQVKLLKYLEADGWRIDVKNHVISAKPPVKLDPQKQIVVTMHAAHGKGAGDTFADYRRIGKLYGVDKEVMMKSVDDGVVPAVPAVPESNTQNVNIPTNVGNRPFNKKR